MDIIDNPSLMEPLLPPEGQRELADLSFDLIKQASALAANLPSQIVLAIGDLVRSMNCYYSNLIEGHNAHPTDIERALKSDFSNEPQKRLLQKEAFAHIALQKLIDTEEPQFPICSKDYLSWLHREFCSRLPDDLLQVADPDTRKTVLVVPGELRTGEVRVGNHLAPVHSKLKDFIALFEQRYSSPALSKLQRIVAVAASHHRLLWIHPFYDGNGRVARLFSHTFLKQVGLGSSLWSVSRGLARNASEYKSLLAYADSWRQGDLDGRGSLSEDGLLKFCAFFLRVCLDQIEFMSKLLEPSTLLSRIEQYCVDQVEKGNLSKGSFQVLREIILSGELERGKVESVTGYKERQSRNIVKALVENNLLVSGSSREPLRINIPHSVVESWFPRLYPTELGRG